MIWLIGSNGMLGSELAKQLNERKLNWIGSNSEVDVSNPKALEDFISKIEKESYLPNELPLSERQIKWIINCSGYTNVEQSETEIEKAEQINKDGARNIARIARNKSIKLIHISTDYIFDGKQNVPYVESDCPNPLNVYGKSKLDGEIEIQKSMNTYYILRTSVLYGYSGKNFVSTMIDLMNNNQSVKVVNDQTFSPTFAPDLAEVIIKFIEKNSNAKSFFGRNSAPAYGIYNFSNKGQTTFFDFAKLIYHYGKKYNKINKDCEIIPISTEEYESKVKRPLYSVLNKNKIENELKIKIPAWEDSLLHFFKSCKL